MGPSFMRQSNMRRMAVTELFSWKEILGCASFNNETGTWKESAEACTLMGGRSKDKNEKNLLLNIGNLMTMNL